MNVNANLDTILRRHDELGARLSQGVAGAEYAQVSRELAELEPIASAIRNLRAKEKERADLVAMLADPALDAEMRAMAEAELAEAEADAEAEEGGEAAGGRARKTPIWYCTLDRPTCVTARPSWSRSGYATDAW